MHLALADLLQGVSLLTLAIKSRQLSGNYCVLDHEWRTSGACTAVGFLTVLSSQASLNILVVLTAARLLVVYKHHQLLVRHTVCWCLIGVSWALALMFAAVPVLTEVLSTKHVLIQPNPYFSDYLVPRKAMLKYMRRTELMYKPTAPAHHAGGDVTAFRSDWFFFTEESATQWPTRRVQVIGRFGYYSNQSVCLPAYYASAYEKGEPAKRSATSLYTFAIVLYNACAIAFVTCAYVIINVTSLPATRGSVKRRSSVQMSKEKATLRRRTALLVATSVSCWAPICACAFAAFAGAALPGGMYAVTQIVLIPVSSCVNPIIYSMLWRNARLWLGGRFSDVRRKWADVVSGSVFEDPAANTANTGAGGGGGLSPAQGCGGGTRTGDTNCTILSGGGGKTQTNF